MSQKKPVSESGGVAHPEHQYLVSMTAFYPNGNTTSIESKGLYPSVKHAVEDVAFSTNAKHYEITVDQLS